MPSGGQPTVEMENILVVDDEEAIREVVSTMLESKGYHCTAVQNGRVAQDQVKKTTPDLVLSDMIMPEMDGIRLLEWMRQYDPEVPVIMVTAIHDISTALEAIRRGAYDYILKPFEKDQLFLGVGRALQHRRLIIENRNYQRNLEQLVEERTAQLTAKHVELEQSYDDTLEALGSALDLKDAETEGHCQRVTAFCISIARAMPVPDPYLAILARAAFLHDIGKMAIPDSILRKPGPLDDAEKKKMREHCEIGYNMLIRISFLRDAAEIVLAHQVFFDGTGRFPPRHAETGCESACCSRFRSAPAFSFFPRRPTDRVCEECCPGWPSCRYRAGKQRAPEWPDKDLARAWLWQSKCKTR